MYQTLDQFVQDLPRHAASHEQELRGHDMTVTIQTRQGRSIAIQLADGQLIILPQAPERVDCAVTADEQAILDMINGKLNPMKAVLLRKVVIRGDAAKLLALAKLV